MRMLIWLSAVALLRASGPIQTEASREANRIHAWRDRYLTAVEPVGDVGSKTQTLNDENPLQ